MKKNSLKELQFGSNEMLTKKQMKNVFGGIMEEVVADFKMFL